MSIAACGSRRRLDRIAIEAGARAGGDPLAAVADLRDRAVARRDGRLRRPELELDAFVGLARSRACCRSTTACASRGPTPPPTVLLDRAPGTLVGRTLIEVFLDTGVEAHRRWRRATAGSSTGEVAVAGADGPTLSIRGRRMPAGSVWLVLEDVSELRRLQQIRTEFIDNLSHELRTPLTTVSLLAETLTREAEAAGDAIPRRMRERIDNIEIETGHLVQMVNELLDLSRIESGGALGALEPVDLGRAGDGVGRAAAAVRRPPAGALATDVEASLPAVRGDEDRLGQVLVNLLHNAVKFSPDGGEVRVVRATRPATRSSSPSPTTASASRGPPRPGSSSGSTRWTGPASAARPVGRASGWRSRGTSSNSTAAGSGSSRPRASAARSRSPSRSRRHDPSDRVGDVADPNPPAGPSRRLAARPREHARGVRRGARRARPATGSSSTSACRPTACR